MYKTLFVLIGCLVIPATHYGLELPKLPFISSSVEHEIELNKDSIKDKEATDEHIKKFDTLRKKLEQELSRQRQSNTQLKQYSKPNKIGR